MELATMFFFQKDSILPNLQMLRLVRLLRLTRIFRSFRAMPCFKELRTMMLCITASLRTLLWCVVMLFLLSFVFSLVFMNGVATFLETSTDQILNAEPIEHWGSIGHSITTLFAAVTGGNDWRTYHRPLVEVGRTYSMFFVVYIGLNLLCVMNIVMALYVESAMSGLRDDHEGNLMAELENLLSSGEDFTRMFHVLHKQVAEPSVPISRAMFVERMRSPVVRAYFAVNGMKIWDADEFFDRLMSMAGKSPNVDLDVDTFVEGCVKLRAPGMDLGMYTSFNELRRSQQP